MSSEANDNVYFAIAIVFIILIVLCMVYVVYSSSALSIK